MAPDPDHDGRASKRNGTTNANTPVDRPSGDRNTVDPLSRKGADNGQTAAERMTDLERQANAASLNQPSGA